MEILAETGNIYNKIDKENNNNNNNYFPIVKEILYTAIQKKGFAIEDSSPDHTAQGIDKVAPEETGAFADYSRSKSDNSLGTSRSKHTYYPLL